ncbi:MAG: bifunctional heptose 7-phosphate kinase/heptose 1-phosphate adenyltransferase, partial [Halanaerobiales bacterium]
MNSMSDLNYSFDKYNSLSENRLEEILDAFSTLRISVVGDISLDVYWDVDMTRSKLSRETPNFPLPVVHERFSMGAGGNVAANLANLGVSEVILLSVIGSDWRGLELKKMIAEQGINNQYIIEDTQRMTPAYCKPIKMGFSEVPYEDSRVDFENIDPPSEGIERIVDNKIHDMVGKSDGMAVVDQLVNGIITTEIRNRINELAEDNIIVVDSRENIGKFENPVLKPNLLEAITAVHNGESLNLDDSRYRQENQSNFQYSNWQKTGIKLSKMTGSPVLMTMGKEGAAWIEDNRIIKVPAFLVQGKLDIVGAGDSFLAAFLCSISAGALPEEAIFIANLAAAVTIK